LPFSLASKPQPAAPEPPEQLSPETAEFSNGDSSVIVPNFLGQNLRSVTAQALAKGLAVQVTGQGIAYEQTPPPGAPLPEGRRVFIRFRVGGPPPARSFPPQDPTDSLPRDRLPAASASSLPASG
jgi:hypothetical protein